MVKKDGMILEPSFGKGNRDSKSPSLQERHRDSKALFKGALGFPNLLHELRLNELRHFPCHFHQLRQCHWLEAISGIYPDILIPHFLALGRISTHATHTHSRYELREIRHLQMAVIQIVHQEIGINSNLVTLIIETTFHLYFNPFLSLSSNQSASASSKLHLN